METECSLPCSQESSGFPYPEPYRIHVMHPVSCRPILKYSHLRLGLPSSLLPLGFPPKTPYVTSLLPYSCYMPRACHPTWINYSNNIWLRIQITKFLVMLSSPFPCYLVPLKTKYLLHHPVLVHPSPTCLRVKHKKNINYIYLPLYIDVFPLIPYFVRI